jgi:DNA-binding IclR family transcriptional regulator
LNITIDSKKRYTSLTPAVEQAVTILKYLSSESRLKASVTDISKKVEISKSKTYRILVALQNAGFVLKERESKLYTLGFDIIPIGLKALENINYRKVAGPFLEKLAQETRCTVLFGLIVGKKLMIISKQASGIAVDSRLDVGTTLDVFFKAHGRVILASLPEEEQKRLLSGGNFFSDDKLGTIDNSQLRQEISEIKKKGFATDIGELSPTIKTLSSVIIGHNNHPIGALIVIGLMKKSEMSKHGTKIVETAKELSVALGAHNGQY